MTTYHRPALLQELLALLSPGLKDGWIVDATLGGGGHASALLDATPPAVRLLGVDRDPQALEAGGAALARFGDRAQTRRARFSTLADIVREVGAAPLRAVVLDIGVSSAQLDRAERGFSLRSEGPLDMSMDGPGGERALELLRDTGADELARWLRDYGDVPRPRHVARIILQAVADNHLRTTTDLADLMQKRFGWLRKGGRHPATRVFQAIRIVVNEEIEELEAALETIPELLAPGGRMAVIAWHSVEDRMVKHGFRALARTRRYALVVKKPVRPGEEEIRENPRSRSARLRVLERVAEAA